MKRKMRLICVLLIVTLLLGETLPVSAAAQRVVMPAFGTVSGKYLYFALGQDGGGALYKYNLSTGKKALLVNGACRHIMAKGNYLYFSQNMYGGTDATDYMIYRVSKNGKGKKKLADGRYPVVSGNYIYYIAVQKEKQPWTSGKVDGKVLGIYRMKLDGTKKTRIYADSTVTGLAVGSGNLYLNIRDSSTWKVFNLKTKKVSTTSILSHPMNTSCQYVVGYRSVDYCNVTGGGYTYTFSGGKAYRWKGNTKKQLLSVQGTIRKLFYTNDYVIAIAERNTGTYLEVKAYMVNKNGKGKKAVSTLKFYAGGGWYY